MTVQERLDMELDRILEIRNVLSSLQLYLEIHFTKCPRGRQTEQIKQLNKYVESIDGILADALSKIEHVKEHHVNKDGQYTESEINNDCE